MPTTTTAENKTVQEIFESLIDRKATIFKYGEMGFPHSIRCTIKKVYRANYAQYRDLLHIVYRPAGKRTDYVFRVQDYSSFLVYAGHVILRDSMFVSSEKSDTTGITLQKSLLSFSNEYMTIAKNSTDQTPIIEVTK